MSAVLYIVVPCYNEEKVLPITAEMFLEELNLLIRKNKVSEKSKILFVDDGSKDHTWEIITGLAKENGHFNGIQQSRNRGHQNTLLAGLMEVRKKADITISIDCDGQDDIRVMEQMVDAYYAGNEVVYGVRSSRDTDTYFKRMTAEWFYRFLNTMGAEVVFNHADYRLLSSRVLEALAGFKEINIFLRGMIPLAGFSSTCVYYERKERLAGDSHYPLKKMVALALDGITSLSIKPIRLIAGLGSIIAVISFAAMIWTVIQYFAGKTVPGWASMTSGVCFLSGIQLICIGVLGEYIGKIYLEVKARPRYIISDKVEGEEQ